MGKKRTTLFLQKSEYSFRHELETDKRSTICISNMATVIVDIDVMLRCLHFSKLIHLQIYFSLVQSRRYKQHPLSPPCGATRNCTRSTTGTSRRVSVLCVDHFGGGGGGGGRGALKDPTHSHNQTQHRQPPNHNKDNETCVHI